MTSRQSAFFFLNSDPMMQNILEIDYPLRWIRSLSGCRQGSKTVSTEVKYINEKTYNRC